MCRSADETGEVGKERGNKEIDKKRCPVKRSLPCENGDKGER